MIIDTLLETARAFRQGQEGLANQKLNRLVTKLDHRLSKLPQEQLQRLNPQLEETLQAIATRDFLWAADLLEYEIKPLLETTKFLSRQTQTQPAPKKDVTMTDTKKLPKSSSLNLDAASFRLDWGVYGLLKLLQEYHFDQVLDIGSGAGEHKRFLELFGKQVFSVDLVNQADYVGDFMQVEFERRFEVIWCSHVLEHQRNIGLFLDKIFNLLTDDGVLAITVPIHPRERLISGHLSSWSIPLLCYNLVMAGFDCREAQIIETFELGLIVQKKPAIHPERYKSSAHGADAGHGFADLAEFFPFDANQGAEISGPGTINWDNFLAYSLPRTVQPALTNIIINSKNFDNEPDLKPTITLRDAPSTDRTGA